MVPSHIHPDSYACSPTCTRSTSMAPSLTFTAIMISIKSPETLTTSTRNAGLDISAICRLQNRSSVGHDRRDYEAIDGNEIDHEETFDDACDCYPGACRRLGRWPGSEQ